MVKVSKNFSEEEFFTKFQNLVKNMYLLSFSSASGRDYVATRPTCGPPLILSPALKRWGPPRRQGLCSWHRCWPWPCQDSFLEPDF